MPTAKKHDLESLLNGELAQLPNDAGVLAWDDVLLPLPQINDDPVRKPLDKAVTAALDLDPEWLAHVRHALTGEPSVTNRPFGTD